MQGSDAGFSADFKKRVALEGFGTTKAAAEYETNDRHLHTKIAAANTPGILPDVYGHC